MVTSYRFQLVHVDGCLHEVMGVGNLMAGTELGQRLARLCADGNCCIDLPAAMASLNGKAVDEQATMYAALGDPQRLRIVRLVQRTPDLCGCELQAMLGLTHATISHHMKRLREAGLVDAERRGKWTHYRYAGPAGL